MEIDNNEHQLNEQIGVSDAPFDGTTPEEMMDIDFLLTEEMIEKSSDVIDCPTLESLPPKIKTSKQQPPLTKDDFLNRIARSKFKFETSRSHEREKKPQQRTLTRGIKLYNCISNIKRIWNHLMSCKSYRDQVSFVSSIVPDNFSRDTTGTFPEVRFFALPLSTQSTKSTCS